MEVESTSVSGLDSSALVAALVANPHQIHSHQLWPWRRVQKNSLFSDALSSGVAMNMIGMWQKKMLGHPRPQECWLLLYVYVCSFVCFDVLTCLVKNWLFRWSVGCFFLSMGRWFLWRLEFNIYNVDPFWGLIRLDLCIGWYGCRTLSIMRVSNRVAAAAYGKFRQIPRGQQCSAERGKSCRMSKLQMLSDMSG